MSPPSPPAAVPVPIDIDPDAPDDDTPELNTKAPLTPFALLEFGVRIYIWPDVLAVPVPLNIDCNTFHAWRIDAYSKGTRVAQPCLGRTCFERFQDLCHIIVF